MQLWTDFSLVRGIKKSNGIAQRAKAISTFHPDWDLIGSSKPIMKCEPNWIIGIMKYSPFVIYWTENSVSGITKKGRLVKHYLSQY